MTVPNTHDQHFFSGCGTYKVVHKLYSGPTASKIHIFKTLATVDLNKDADHDRTSEGGEPGEVPSLKKVLNCNYSNNKIEFSAPK